MSKNPDNKQLIRKTIRITQAIEGYKPAHTDTVKKVKELKKRYAIKISAQ